jgi:hypothetical protein
MPFGLINVRVTLQRDIDINFRGLINLIVVYLGVVTIYSNKQYKHIRHLKQFFERCKK